jgi:MFS family permease
VLLHDRSSRDLSQNLGEADREGKPVNPHNCYGRPSDCRNGARAALFACTTRHLREANVSSIVESDAIVRDSAFNRGLTREQRKNLVLASLGSMLEFYEFMVFGFLTVVIARQFFPASMPDAVKTFQAFAIFSLGFLLRPLSGVILGHLGDRIGRKKMFLFTVFAMAVPTLMIGLLPTYAQIGIAAPLMLLTLRMAQGVAIAGEFAGAAVFVFEHSPAQRVGYALGWMMGGSYLGFFMGAAIGALLSHTLDPAALASWGWRVAFIAGGIFGLIAVYLRRSLDETPLFKEISKIKATSDGIPLLNLLRQHIGSTLFVTGCGAYLGIMVLIVYFYMPTFLQVQYGLSSGTTFNANAAGLLILALTCPIWGLIADRIGAAKVLGISACGTSALVFLLFRHIDAVADGQAQLMWWYMAISAFMGSAVAVALFSALSFPTQVRFSGFGLCYNLGIVISGLTPTLLALLVIAYGNTSVPYAALVDGALGVVLAAAASHIKQYPRAS